MSSRRGTTGFSTQIFDLPELGAGLNLNRGLLLVEYLLRMWVCTVDIRYAHLFWGRIKYAITPLSLIDLFSIVPFYLLLLFPGLSFFNLISLLRLLRLLKMSRYSESVRTLGTVDLGQCAADRSSEVIGEIEVSFEQKQRAISLHIENSADLMKLCIDTAKQKFGTAFEKEEIIRDLAIHLYNEALQKFNL